MLRALITKSGKLCIYNEITGRTEYESVDPQNGDFLQATEFVAGTLSDLKSELKTYIIEALKSYLEFIDATRGKGDR